MTGMNFQTRSSAGFETILWRFSLTAREVCNVQRYKAAGSRRLFSQMPEEPAA